MSTLEEELEFAIKIAREAWKLAEPIYDGPRIFPKRKPDGSEVTPGDLEINDFISTAIQQTYPSDGLVTEESDDRTVQERTWYVDPIDGTKGFISRSGQFAIQIGLAIDGDPELGVLYAPANGDLYAGVAGKKALRSSRGRTHQLTGGQAAVSYDRLMDRMHPDRNPEWVKAFVDEMDFGTHANHGSEGLRFMRLAEDSADVRIMHRKYLNTWDICGPQAILEAAGGWVGSVEGTRFTYDLEPKIQTPLIAARSLEIYQHFVDAIEETGFLEHALA